jgi:two-component system NtrC family sensor kinase
MRWSLPFRRSETLVVLTQLACAGALMVQLAAWLTGRASPLLGDVLLGGCIALFAAAALRASRRATDARRALYRGMAGAALLGLVAEVVLVVEISSGVPLGPVTPDLLIFVFGAHPSFMIGLAATLGVQRRELQVEALLDALLLVAAAMIVHLLLPYGSLAGGGLTDVERGVYVFWRSLIAGELFLVALLIARRGELLGLRTSLGLAVGTIAFALTNAVQSQGALASRVGAAANSDALWTLVLLAFSLALWPRRDAAVQADARLPREATSLRAGSLVAAALVLTGLAVALGISRDRRPELGLAIAGVGVLLAARAAYALMAQRHEARALATTVEAERELSATLEQRVDERTAELAEAQRVLQRMWGFGQQIATELHPARVLQRFMEAVADVTHADGGALGLLTDDGATVRIAAATGIDEALLGRTVPVVGSAIGRVIRGGRPWTAPDVAADPDLVYVPLHDATRVPLPGGLAMVPLQRRGEIIGAVGVASRTPRQFSDSDLARIAAMGDMLSIALANAELVENLRQAEWRFRTLFRAAPDAVFSVLASGRVREANDAVRELTGLDPTNLLGRTFGDLVIAEDRARLEEALASAFAGTPARLEVRFRREQGTRAVALAASRLPEADPPTVLLIGRDITGEREMRARLMETERLAAVGELVAGVAHEVNNPLSSISAFAQLLLRDGGLSATQRDSIEVIKAETLRASQVVKDLLAFARRSEPMREPLDLNVLVERTLRLRGYELGSSGITLEQSLDGDLPAVIGDARQLQQVVLNLITNAVQAMTPLGGGTLRVRTRCGDGSVILEMSDSGPGIPAAARARVFEPFFTTKDEGEGTGLGLSVSYGIVAAHGGSITIAETSERGTTFAVALPAVPAPTPGVTIQTPSAPLRSPLSGLRLLFVDDEPALRSGVEAFGRMRGFDVVTAPEGRAALAAIQTTSFDAVVCDLRMPGMDGFAFLDALRSERPGLAARTIVITGDLLTTSGRLGGGIARQPTLTKPFTFERLEDALVAVLRGFSVPSAATSLRD